MNLNHDACTSWRTVLDLLRLCFLDSLQDRWSGKAVAVRPGTSECGRFLSLLSKSKIHLNPRKAERIWTWQSWPLHSGFQCNAQIKPGGHCSRICEGFLWGNKILLKHGSNNSKIEIFHYLFVTRFPIFGYKNPQSIEISNVVVSFQVFRCIPPCNRKWSCEATHPCSKCQKLKMPKWHKLTFWDQNSSANHFCPLVFLTEVFFDTLYIENSFVNRNCIYSLSMPFCNPAI